MKFQNKLYLFSTLIIVLITLTMLFAGSAVIDNMVCQANKRLFTARLENISRQFDDAYDLSKTSGTTDNESCRASIRKELTGKLKNYTLRKTEKIFILDTNGKTWSIGNSSTLDKRIIAKILDKKRGIIKFQDKHNRTRLLAFLETKWGWKTVLSIDKNVISTKCDLYFNIIVCIGLLILILTLISVYIFSNKLSKQISEMLGCLKKVSQGDLTTSVEIAQFSDEHEQLSKGINLMIKDLRLKEIEREQADYEARRHQKIESIGILAGGIAHDFNNLLTAIRGNIQLALMNPTQDETLQICLKDSEKATVRAMDLTKQLLTFSKGETPTKQTASITELLEHSATFMLRGAKSKCKSSFADNLKPVDIDPGQIGQVIDNIVINANQAMPQGGIITICAENVSITEKDALPIDDGEYIIVSISDQGSGIKPEEIDKVFDPFFSTKTEGSGLGLATSATILKKHNGHIKVDSTSTGTCFSIYLPVSTQTSVEQGTATESKRYSGGGRILIMDDQESIRELLSKMLGIMSCKCTHAEDGDSTIRLYKEAMDAGNKFDVIFMDLTIPGGMGGKEAVIKLQELDPDVKAIVASGYSNDPVMAEHAKHGFSGKLEKPFKIEDLNTLMHEIMDKHRKKK